MTTYKLLKICVLGSALIALQACSSNTESEAQAKPVQANVKTSASVIDKTQYAKPGAAVSFGNSYNGHTEVGETANFQIVASERYESGALNISIKTSDGLALNSGATQMSFSMNDDAEKVIDISVSAQTAGQYYVHVQGLADTGSGQIMPRSYSVAIYVGDKSAYTKPANDRKVENTPSGRIIVMDAEETIQ